MLWRITRITLLDRRRNTGTRYEYNVEDIIKWVRQSRKTGIKTYQNDEQQNRKSNPQHQIVMEKINSLSVGESHEFHIGWELVSWQKHFRLQQEEEDVFHLSAITK